MVGFDWKQEHHLSAFWQGMAGVFSGTITRFLCQPLDVLKIRFQLQHEPLKKGQENYYWSMKHASSRILREESYRALWKGHMPAQMLSGVYGMAQFSTFEFLTKTVYVNSYTKPKGPAVHFFCGSVSGAVATILSMPFDTIRTRLVGQGEPKIYKSLWNALRTIIKVEGAEGLYRGLVPTLLQIMPFAGLQFGFFEFFSQTYSRVTKIERKDKLPVMGNLLCGSAAGILAKVAVYPLDLTKKRLQVQGFEAARKQFGTVRSYEGWRQCIKYTVKKEGVPGLFKGLSPSLVKAMVTSGLTFTLYEEISNIFRNLHV